MRKRVILPIVPLLLAAAPSSVEPGMWEAVVRVESMQVPNLPPDLAKSLAGQAHTIRSCLKAADLERTPERVFAVTKGDCSYSNFSMQGGKVSGTLTCKGGLVSQLSGRYTATTYEVKTRTSMKGGMTSTSSAAGRRVGPC